jgi:peptidyl-prolyl cis-trans isomerase D
MRKAAESWVAKLFFVVLVASFAVWGIGGRIEGGSTGNSVLTAGDTTVSLNEYRLAYDRQLSSLSQQLGQRLTRQQATAVGVDRQVLSQLVAGAVLDEQARRLGLGISTARVADLTRQDPAFRGTNGQFDRQVLSQLVAGAVLDEQARRLGLGISTARVADLTRQDPAFRGTNGQFDRQQFDYVLKQIGMRPEEYMRNREQVAVRQQIIDAATEGMKAPATFLKAVALYRGEDRTVEYVTLPQSLVEPIEDPSPSTLQTWFDKNKKKYAAPEYRKIAYVRLEPQDIADPASISDDQIKQDYEAHSNNYTTPEKRTIEQIVFKDEASAKAGLPP